METSWRVKLMTALGLTLFLIGPGLLLMNVLNNVVKAQDPRQQRRINAARNRSLDLLDKQIADAERARQDAGKPALDVPDDRPLKARLDEVEGRVRLVLDKLNEKDRHDVVLWANLRSNWHVEKSKSRPRMASRPAPPGPAAKSTPKDHLDNAKRLSEDPAVPREVVQKRLREVAERFPNTSEADGAKKLLKELEEMR